MNSIILFSLLGLLASIGGIAIAVINRHHDTSKQKQAWIKYVVYLFIVFSTLACIVFIPTYFHMFCTMIVLCGMVEIIRLQFKHQAVDSITFTIIIIGYLIASFLFLLFSRQHQEVLLFTFFIVICFDAFSQIAGQLFGKRKLFPTISPNKTAEGLAGGLISAISIGFLIGSILMWNWEQSLVYSFAIAGFAFAGDILASCVKRLYGVKDFSKVIPGHGGMLDRFDSLIVGGAGVTILLTLKLLYE